MPETLDLGMLHQAAPVASIDEAARTVEVVFTTGARVKQWMNTQAGFQRVTTQAVVTEEAADLRRLNARGKVLNSHSDLGVADVLGTVEKAWIEKGKGRATLRFSEATDVEPIWQRIREKVLTDVSMGFMVHEVEIAQEKPARKDGDPTELYRFTKWEPVEISIVGTGADPGARIQSAQAETTAAIVRREQEAAMADKDTAVEAEVAQAPAAPIITQAEVEAMCRQAREAERARVGAIRVAGEKLAAPAELIQSAIETGETLDAFRVAAVEAFVSRAQTATAGIGGPRAMVTGDARDRFRQGAVLGIMKRAGVKGGERNEFSGLRLEDLARRSIELTEPGRRFSDRQAMIGYAFVQAAGAHTTSDFANILADVANKAVLQGWEQAEESFTVWTRPGTLTDFRSAKRVGTGIISALPKIEDGATYTYGTIGDRGEPITLATYGKILKFTRQTIINDDLQALTSVPTKMGAAARRTIGDLVYAILTGNPTMSDAVALFHSTHANLASSGAAPSVATLGAARAAMRKQSDQGKALNIAPFAIIVPAALETVTSQLLNSSVDPTATKGMASNPVAGMARLVVDARLDAASATAWYLTASPTMHDVVEVAYLDGNDQPFLDQQMAWNSDGVEYKVRIDAGVAPLDYRTMYKDPGA